MFLHSFNYFRGVSIIFIVASHTYLAAHWGVAAPWERFIGNFFAGGSILFVFISGFLFHHVFFQKYDYLNFLGKKLQNVLSPYLVLISLPILYAVITKQDAPNESYIFTDTIGLWGEYIRPALLYLWTGSAVPTFWFIPFIMLVFLLSPLFVGFIRLPYFIQTFVLILLIALSMAVHRPPYNLYPLQALGYFSSVFAFGSYCSLHRDKMYPLLEKREWWLLIPIIALTAYQVSAFPYYGAIAAPIFEPVLDVTYLSKMLLCIFFMVFLRRFETHYMAWLDALAKASFPIYLLHSFVIEGSAKLLRTLDIRFVGSWATWVGYTIATLLITYYLAVLLRHFIGKRSRYFIGW